MGKVKLPQTWIDPPDINTRIELFAARALVGFLVALTSIGSGSLLMVFLLLLTPYPPREPVGADILYSLATMTLAGSLHIWMGHFDTALFLRIVLGSLPDVVLGSRLTPLIPARYFSWLFTVL